MDSVESISYLSDTQHMDVDLNSEDIMESGNVDSESSVYTPSDLCENSVDSIPFLSDSEEMFESKTNVQQTMEEFKKVDFHLQSKSSFDLFGAKQNVGGSVKNFDEDSASSVHTPSELCEYSDESNDMLSLDVHEEIVDNENDYNNNDWQQQTIQDSNNHSHCEESDKMDWDTGNIDVNSEEAINSFDRNTNFIQSAHSSGKIIIHQNILLKAPFEEFTKEINEYDNTIVNNTQHPIEHSHDSKKKEICDNLECKFDSSEAKESTEEAMECCIDSHISISDDEVDNLVNNNQHPIEHSHDSSKKIERCEKTECKFDSSEVEENIEEAMECSIGSHISISDEEVDILESSPASCMPGQMTLTEKHSNSYQHSIQVSFNDGNEMKKSGNVESTFYLPEVKENSKLAISSFDRNTNLILPAHSSKKIIIFPNIIIKLPFVKHTKEVDKCDKTIVDNTKHAIEHSHDSSKKIEIFEKTECKFDATENSGEDKCSIDSHISISDEEVDFIESSSALGEAEEAISSFDKNTNLNPPALSSKKIIIHQNILLKAPIEEHTEEINKYHNTIVNNTQHPIEHSHDSDKKMESCEKTECKFDLSDAKENSGEDKCSIDSHISISDKEGNFIESSSALGEEAISSFDRNTNFIPPVLSSKKIIIHQNILLKPPFQELTKKIDEYDNTIVNKTQHPIEHSHDSRKKISDGEVDILESSPGVSMSERITLTDNHSSVDQHSSQESYNDGDKMKECEYVGCEFDSSEGKENHKEIIKFSVSSKKQREKDALTETNPLNDRQSLVEGTSDTVIDNEYEVSKNISRNYYMDLTLSNLINCPSMELEEGASYKFRLAAANLNGQGEWSEELLVKSRKIGLPAAPVVYDFVLTKFGACLSWETSSADDRDNVEYSLYLGVKRKKREKTHKMKFKIVYCGHENRCFIRNAVLSGARIDTTHSPALIFRLLVKGDNGIGSVNQIRCSNVQTCVNNKTIQQLLREQL